MSDIRVQMKDGTVRDFPDNGAPGGSYCNKLIYEGAFAIIEDPYGTRTSIPSDDIKYITHETERRHRW